MTVIYYGNDYVTKKFTDNKKFRIELESYRKLDGMGVTPKLLEVGEDYIKIEKYDISLEMALISEKINAIQYHDIYKRIVDLVKILDQMGIIHNDLATRNVVCKNYFGNIAIIDFELAVILEPNSKVTNFDMNFYHQF